MSRRTATWFDGTPTTVYLLTSAALSRAAEAAGIDALRRVPVPARQLALVCRDEVVRLSWRPADRMAAHPGGRRSQAGARAPKTSTVRWDDDAEPRAETLPAT